MKRVLISLSILCILAGVAAADPIDLPLKWSQTPWDPHGSAVYSDHTAPSSPSYPNQVSADDFVCDSRDPVVAVRWWGLYVNPIPPHPPAGGHVQFDISFHLSTGQHPTSLPADDPIVLYPVMAQEVEVGTSGGWTVYRYDAYLPEDFDQWFWSHVEAASAGANIGELFIDICRPSGEGWAWCSVLKDDPSVPIGDWCAATLDGTGHVGPWTSLAGSDLAFELMTVPEPATMCLVALGLAGLVAKRKRRP